MLQNMFSSSINEKNKKCICAYDKLQFLQTDHTNYGKLYDIIADILVQVNILTLRI